MTENPEGSLKNAEFERVISVLRQILSGEPPPPGQSPGKAWVEGEDEDGMTIVAVQVDDSVYHLKVPDVQSLAQLVGPRLKPRKPLETLTLPYRTQTGPSLSVVLHGVTPGDTLSIVCAGDKAQAMTAIESVQGETLDVSCFTCRGPTQEKQGMEYKPINEDGVLVCVRRGNPEKGLSEWALIGAFDQAGGEGSVEDHSGAASEAAAWAFEKALARLEKGENWETVLKETVEQANKAVHDLNVGAVSTLAVACMETRFAEGQPATRRAMAAAVGDSRVLWVSKDGELKGKTELHNLGSQVAKGQVEEIPAPLALRFAGALSRGLGTDDATVDLYSWDVASGDFLVVETDGVGDAHELEDAPPGHWHADQCALAQARVLGPLTSSGQAVETLLGYALDQMATRYGKPDNIGLAVIRVG